MKLEDQVCSLALAKRLKELGVRQNGHFHWVYFDWTNDKWIVFHFPHEDEPKHFDCYSAFTVAELGEMLPPMVIFESYVHEIYIRKTPDNKWWVSYENGRRLCKEIVEKTEADAHAKMLIYLIEKGLVKL